MDDYPGIEIRCITPEGLKFFEGNSQRLHFDLAAAGFRPDMSGDNWYPVIEGTFTLEIRAVDLPELAAAPDYPAELFRGQPGALAELAELERAAAGRAHERAAAAGLEPLGDVDQAPGHRGCCCHAGFSGDHACCIHPAADVDPGPVYLDTLGRVSAELVRPISWTAEPGYCSETPAGMMWPVCSLLAGHEPATHESADFYWSPGDTEPTHKSYRGPHAAAPVSSAGWEGTGAARPGAGPDGLTELTEEPTRGAPRQARRRLGTGIARIARRARFRSGR